MPTRRQPGERLIELSIGIGRPRRRHAERPPNGWPRGPMAAAIAGAGMGAGLMYLLDPDRGRRRRAMTTDKAVHYAHETEDFTGKAARDLRNRTIGLAAEARKRVRRTPPSSQTLTQRVRTELRRASRHPGAIGVEVRNGVVTLTGPVLRDEADKVRRAVSELPGVSGIEDRLEVKERPGDLPALQGEGGVRAEPPPELLQEYWTPGVRLLAGATGGGLACYGLARRSLPGVLAAGAGAVLLSRAVTNLRLARLTGVGVGRRAVELHKTIEIDAPVERVWELWDDYESFPRFMTNVRQVRKGADGRSHWKVEGPLGLSVQWDAETTRRVPGELLAWKTLPGAAIRHAGIVRLERADGGTRIHVTLSYNPVAGAAGHAVASLLGANPKQQLDEDLLRMKTLLETGKAAHDAAKAD